MLLLQFLYSYIARHICAGSTRGGLRRVVQFPSAHGVPPHKGVSKRKMRTQEVYNCFPRSCLQGEEWWSIRSGDEHLKRGWLTRTRSQTWNGLRSFMERAVWGLAQSPLQVSKFLLANEG
ncbi:hypothetical protein PAXRUDRAFT_622435 [Paxillus rubicundulus Ve08.2h10]|uniref:Uncharacterized protein n=1 Tax=Paxillus rubicundulus Ve08.2h10 TaxID=930991 RepID=A0A0D0DT37_9AGAM|nr:hypothetical protein PAXRUDRAFT_622435 [Paxillus rubicundulus Ve08.2h10]